MSNTGHYPGGHTLITFESRPRRLAYREDWEDLARDARTEVVSGIYSERDYWRDLALWAAEQAFDYPDRPAPVARPPRPKVIDAAALASKHASRLFGHQGNDFRTCPRCLDAAYGESR